MKNLRKLVVVIALLLLIIAAAVWFFYLRNRKPAPFSVEPVEPVVEPVQQPQGASSEGLRGNDPHKGLDLRQFKNIVALPNYLYRNEGQIDIQKGTVSFKLAAQPWAKNTDLILFLGNFNLENHNNALQILIKEGKDVHFNIFDSGGIDDHREADVELDANFLESAHGISVSWDLNDGKGSKKIYIDGVLKATTLVSVDVRKNETGYTFMGPVKDMVSSDNF
ncbi:MAG: hypothetical protein Q8P25_00875 [Candidatus Curtissbacteria bacterium]|nr:hypothetical protein [Candidatus Curtissbacteria bacterium]